MGDIFLCRRGNGHAAEWCRVELGGAFQAELTKTTMNAGSGNGQAIVFVGFEVGIQSAVGVENEPSGLEGSMPTTEGLS